MRFKLSVIMATLFCATELFAQATPPAPGAGATTTIAGTSITWYGMAMFRFRDEITSKKITDNTGTLTYNFTNQLGYKLGAKVAPAKDIMLQFEIGNDWYATDEVEGIPYNGYGTPNSSGYSVKRDPYAPFFDLAYVQWDPGYMHIAAGIIPVQGSALMDLLGMSIFQNNGSYASAAHVPWGVVTNFSQTGFRIGAPVMKGPISITVNAMTAMFQMRQALALDSVNHPAIEYYLEAPITMGGLRVTPQAYFIPNRNFDSLKSNGNAELGVGVDGALKVDNKLTLRGSIGWATNSNSNSFDTANHGGAVLAGGATQYATHYHYAGTNLNVGATAIIGPGKLDVDYNFGLNQNFDAISSVNDKYHFVDLKYGVMVSKYFVICPRIREFLTLPITGYKNKLVSRPELIFIGTF